MKTTRKKSPPDYSIGDKSWFFSPIKNYLFYWVIFILSGIIMCAWDFYLQIQGEEIHEKWQYYPLMVWIAAQSIIWFDTLNICYIKFSKADALLSEIVEHKNMTKLYVGFFQVTSIMLGLNWFLALFAPQKLPYLICGMLLAWLINFIVQIIRYFLREKHCPKDPLTYYF